MLALLGGDGRPAGPQPRGCAVPAALPDLRPGDVVFFSAPDFFWARMASRWSLPRFRHGHVGLAVDGSNGRVLIVHATGNPVASDAKVVAVPPGIFLADAARIDVFRPTSAPAAAKAMRQALSYAAAGLPFDTAFSLVSADKLYCSELVWRALSVGYGHDIVPHKSRVAGTEAVLLSDLERASELRLVTTVWRRCDRQSSR